MLTAEAIFLTILFVFVLLIIGSVIFTFVAERRNPQPEKSSIAME
jgi:hypothetical protein